MSECEKKWRYLRDKYVKERRRLIDETKATGKEVKSNWQHFESMEFLSTHLRLASNNNISVDRNSLATIDDDDSLKLSGDSPTMPMMSPHHQLSTDSNIKQEMSLQPPTNEWTATNTTTEPDKHNYQPGHSSSSELYQHSASSLIPPPPSYPSSLFGRPVAPSLSHNPLWAMWANSMHQATQHLNNLNSVRSVGNQPVLPSTSVSSPQEVQPERPASHKTDQAEEQSRPNKRKLSEDRPEINVQLSLKDIQPAQKYTEYHFCLSLAQMMEHVPMDRRPELKIKLIQMINESVNSYDSPTNSSSEPVIV